MSSCCSADRSPAKTKHKAALAGPNRPQSHGECPAGGQGSLSEVSGIFLKVEPLARGFFSHFSQVCEPLAV